MIAEIQKELFILSPIADDPRFEGFALTEAPSILGRDSLDEDITPGFADAETNPDWRQPKLDELWVPPRVIGRVNAYNDYPGLDGMFPVFSERAVDALEDLLQPNGELLPLCSDLDVAFFFFNITTILDVLDRKRSSCEFWSDPPTTAVEIDHFEFHRDRLLGHAIFRLREWPIKVIVSDEFKRRVEEAGLNGFSFAKIWPMPSNRNWRKTERDERKRQGISELKAQTLVLIFPLNAAKPSAEERKLIAKLEDDLDVQLRTPSLDAPYFGSYEGSEAREREYRMFLSTPDVNRLYKKLEPWLHTLEWPMPVTLVKRCGRMTQTNVVEEFIAIG